MNYIIDTPTRKVIIDLKNSRYSSDYNVISAILNILKKDLKSTITEYNTLSKIET